MNTPRLTDVAARAGVSMKTVSNVVNGTGSVRPETRARVQAAIDEVGYRPNVTARRLVTGQTGTISMALSSVTVPYFAQIANLIDQAARQQRLRLVIEQTHGERGNELAVIDERERGLVDGVVFHPVSLTPEDLADRTPGFPLVMLGEGPAPRNIDHVMIDNVAAAGEVTKHLVERGCRRIAFLGTELDDQTETTALRATGYHRALKAAGLPLDERLHLPVHHYSAREGFRAVSEALDGDLVPDGIVCRDDSLATGALHAVHARGLSIPGDVAVAGWDDLVPSRHLWPPLTTIAPDKQALASVAMRLLTERIRGYTGPGRHELVGWELAKRQSTLG